METLLKVLGLLLILEGIPWFLSPRRTRLLLRELARVSDSSLRLYGLVAMLLGLLVVFAATR